MPILESRPTFALPCSILGISSDAKGVEVSAALFQTEDAREPRVFICARQDGHGSSSDAALALVDEVLGNFFRSSVSHLMAATATASVGSHPKDWLSAIAFNAGPGGFTAVRGACAIAQGLAFGWNKPVAALSSLEAWAESVAAERQEHMSEGHSEEILVLLDARMGELYAGHFRLSEGLDMTCSQTPEEKARSANACRALSEYQLTLLDEAVLPPQLLSSWLATKRTTLHRGGPAWYCGDFQVSFPALAEALEAQGWAFPAFLDFRNPKFSSKGLLRLAFSRREAVFQEASTVVPHYVRNKVALNSGEQQTLREQNRAATLISSPQEQFRRSRG